MTSETLLNQIEERHDKGKHEKITPFLSYHPLCQKCRVVKIV